MGGANPGGGSTATTRFAMVGGGRDGAEGGVREFDVVVVGAGAVGAALAFRLAPRCRVLVLEREAQPGYHSTGRSAAHYTDTIGGAAVRALSRETRRFIDDPPSGFAATPLLTPRPVLLLQGRGDAHDGGGERLKGLIGSVLQPLDAAACLRCCPVLRPEAIAGGLWEAAGGDLDVHAIHGGYLAAARRAGAELLCAAEVRALERRHGTWRLETAAGRFAAPMVANCAGAWGDELAAMAGARPAGLQPLRRTAFTFRGPQGVDCSAWPLVADEGENFYFKPEAGLLLGSLADETPSPPCDAQAEELDLAQAAANIMAWTTLKVARIERRWAGLRSFVADRAPVVGFDPAVAGLFWNVGQGGAGIQTSAALSAYAAAVLLGDELPPALARHGLTKATFSPARLGA